MSNHRNRLWIVVAVAASAMVVVLLLGWFIANRSAPLAPAANPPSQPPSAKVEVPDLDIATSDAFAPQVSAVRLSPPPAEPDIDAALPAADASLVEQLPALRALADRGHPEAACRLMVQVQVCRDFERNAGFARQLQGDLVRVADPGKPTEAERMLIGAVAAGLEHMQSAKALCRHFRWRNEEFDESALLDRVVSQLSVRQRVILAMLDESGRLTRLPQHALGDVLVGGSTDYVYPSYLSENAIQFLRSGIEAADPLALEGMIVLHAPVRFPGPQGVRFQLPDAYRFAGYASLMVALYGHERLGGLAHRSLERVLDRLDAQQRRQLDAAVELEARRWRAVQVRRPSRWPDTESAIELCAQ